MAERLDVAERVAEGLPAVEHTQRYVRACQALGYENPDLTSRPSQIRDWYDSEVGLDLHMLDADCAQLRAAGVAVLEALRIQRGQVAELAAAWTGPGADSAVAFLQRHCDAGNMVANEVRAAAQRCESLRDNLWYLLDAKVSNTLTIDDRTLAQRPAWLAAADAVTTGVGDRQTADAVIHQQVTPYVHNDIGNDWLDVMRSTKAGVATAYDMVIDRLAAVPPVQFEIPAELVVGRAPFQPAPPSAPAPPAAVAPAAAIPATVAPPAVPPTAPLGDAAGMATAGEPGGAGSGLGGLGGLASRIVDAMGTLLGPADDQGSRDPFDRGALDDDPFHPDHEHDDVDDKPDSKAAEHDRPDETRKSATARPVEAKPAVAVPPPADAPAPADPMPPATAPAPAAGPGQVDGSTPCEIAADQLPQAGQ